jgi:hypothetical protein
MKEIIMFKITAICHLRKDFYYGKLAYWYRFEFNYTGNIEGKNIKIEDASKPKIKEKYIRDGIADFAARLTHYCDLSIIEVEDNIFWRIK